MSLYRCYLLRNGHIAVGDDIDVDGLEAALAHARGLIAARSATETFGGVEIWCGSSLVHSDAPRAAADGAATGVESPFETPESTILPNWRPSASRTLLAARDAASREGAKREAPSREGTSGVEAKPERLAEGARPRRAISRKARTVPLPA
jgi:hypothetical protein